MYTIHRNGIEYNIHNYVYIRVESHGNKNDMLKQPEKEFFVLLRHVSTGAQNRQTAQESALKKRNVLEF